MSFIAEKMDYGNATLSLALFPLIGWVIYRMHKKAKVSDAAVEI